MRIGLVVLDQCFGAGVASILDVLQTADAIRADVDPAIPAIEVELVGNRRTVASASGVGFTTTRTFADLDQFDIVLLGALGAMNQQQTLALLAGPDSQALIASLRRGRQRDALLASACTGTFVLAEAGILDGGRATTSWWLWPAFRERYPAVDLEIDAMVVTDERAITAGAAFAHIDLALTLLRRASPRLAEVVARLLVVDNRPAQSAYLALDHLEHSDPLVLAFEDHVRANLGQPIDIGTAADKLGVGRRTLERRVSRALGVTPVALVQRLRVERAAHLLRTTGQSADQIAPQVGYLNGSTLRALIRRSS